MVKKEADKETMKFWNESANVYSEGVQKELKDQAHRDRWVNKILEFAPKKDKLKILDIGTGPGFFTINFAALGHDVRGIDISPEMVRVANENAKSQGLDCEFKVMNANTLEFEDNTFDLLINRVVTWTLPDLYDCYKEWRRVLAPNGKIVLFDANYYINHFDEEKAKTMRLMMRERMIAGEEFSDHFDFHVRWKYWEQSIPNIGIDRPKYDANLLNKLRFINIRTIDNVFPDKYKEVGTSTPTFLVSAEKPSEDQENQFIVNEYWDAIAGAVSARAVKMIKGKNACEYAKTLSAYISAGAKVLDVGTGSGTVAIPLAKMGYDVTGVDWSAPMIDMAKLTAEEMDAKVKFAVADAQGLPCQDETYDVVVLRNVVWNTYHPQKVICEAARVLKKGGALIVTDGNWQADIAKWESENEDHSAFPNYRKRDLGLGAFEIINEYYGKLPLNNVARPAWDNDAVAKASLKVEKCEAFTDPMLTDELKPVLKPGFILVARK